jgi:hypothetical protein
VIPRVRFLLTGSLLLATLLAGCSASDATPTRVAGKTLNEVVVKRLVTGDEITSVGGDGGGLSASVEDLREFAKAIDPSQIEGVESWFSLSLASGDGPGLTLTIKRFTTTVLANRSMAIIESGGTFMVMENPIGERSALSLANPDIGASITFVENSTSISIQLPMTTDGATLLDDHQLTALAQIIADRL